MIWHPASATAPRALSDNGHRADDICLGPQSNQIARQLWISFYLAMLQRILLFCVLLGVMSGIGALEALECAAPTDGSCGVPGAMLGTPAMPIFAKLAESIINDDPM